MNRRQFIKQGVVGTGALTIPQLWTCDRMGRDRGITIPRRTLGRTGEMLSIIGFGGILVDKAEQKIANALVTQAIDKGVNYFDVAPSYGNAEERLGPALAPYRKDCFLACKTTHRERQGAEKELNESLVKLQTDHFDLYQLHAITTIEDVEKAFGPRGAMEAIFHAREQGKIRFLGFSAHSEEAALLAMDKFDFDTILFPINFVCWLKGQFGPNAIARAHQKKMGILALKSLAFTHIPEGTQKPYEKLWYVPIEDSRIANLAIRFTLSQGTTAAIPPGDSRFFWKALEIAMNYRPLEEQEMVELHHIAEEIPPWKLIFN